MAAHAHTTSRRRLLSAAPAILVMSGAAIAAPAAQNPDAELIRVCQAFAEVEFADWYRYLVTDDGEAEHQFEDTLPDWATLRQIEATPATTLEGMRAKALAFVAWDRESYDNSPDSRDGHTTLLASLLRDLAAPARAAIIARLAKQYGPLPEGYTSDGVWVGRAAA